MKCRISRNLITGYMNSRKQKRNYICYFLFTPHSNSDMISDKKYIYIFDFVPIPGRTPWNFLHDGGRVCYVNEVTFGHHLKIGAGCQSS